MTLRFVPLSCPSCGRDLPALEDDVVFACARCRRGMELRDDKLVPRPLRVLPQPSAASGFHLPFWDLGGQLRVPAFNTREVLVLTRRFSDRPVGARDGALLRLVGGSLPSDEAARAAEFLGFPPAPGPVQLLAVPFVEEGSRLLDLWTGSRLYREAIDRCDELVLANLDRPPPSA